MYSSSFFPLSSKFFLSIVLLFTFNFITTAQVNLYVAGNNGVGLYIGQDLTVQALGNVDIAAVGTMSFENGGTPDFRLKGDFTNLNLIDMSEAKPFGIEVF